MLKAQFANVTYNVTNQSSAASITLTPLYNGGLVGPILVTSQSRTLPLVGVNLATFTNVAMGYSYQVIVKDVYYHAISTWTNSFPSYLTGNIIGGNWIFYSFFTQGPLFENTNAGANISAGTNIVFTTNGAFVIISQGTNGTTLGGLQASNMAPNSGVLPSGILTAGSTNGAGHLLVINANGYRYITYDASLLINLNLIADNGTNFTIAANGNGLVGGVGMTNGAVTASSIAVQNLNVSANTVATGPITSAGGIILTGTSTLNGNVTGSGFPVLSSGAAETNAYITNSSFAGNGASITGLNPANISAGTASINITGISGSTTNAQYAIIAGTTTNAQYAIVSGASTNAQYAITATLATNAINASIASNLVFGSSISNATITASSINDTNTLIANSAVVSNSFTAGTIAGNGSAITALNGSQITSGTIPPAAISPLGGFVTGPLGTNFLSAAGTNTMGLIATNALYGGPITLSYPFQAPGITIQSSYNLKFGSSSILFGNGISGAGFENVAGTGFSDLWLGPPIGSWPQLQISTGPPTVTIIGGDGSTPANLDVSGNIVGNGNLITALNGSQVISGTVPATQLPVATASAYGIVRPDNTTVTISGGVLSSVGGAGGGGNVYSNTTTWLNTLNDTNENVKQAVYVANSNIVLSVTSSNALIPVMIASNLPTGYAFAYSSNPGNPPWQGFQGAVTGLVWTGNNSDTIFSWLGYELPTPQTINSSTIFVSLISGSGNINDIITLQYSLDGINWISIGQTNFIISSFSYGVNLNFNFQSITAQYWRWYFTGTSIGTSVSVYTAQLYSFQASIISSPTNILEITSPAGVAINGVNANSNTFYVNGSVGAQSINSQAYSGSAGGLTNLQGNGNGFTNLNGNSFSTPVSAVDLSGPIAINANPTPIGPSTSFQGPTNFNGHGEVQLVGGIINNSTMADATNAFDGSFITYCNDNPAGKIGLNCTNPFIWTRVRLAPQPSFLANYYPASRNVLNGVQFATCTDSSFDNQTNWGSTPPYNPNNLNYPYAPRYQFTEYLVSMNQSNQYVFLNWTNGDYSLVGEIQIIGINTTNAKPVAPVISPWGGHFPNSYPYYGSALVALSSISTASQIYWTTNNWINSNLYSAPFYLNSLGQTQSSPISLQARAYDSGLLIPWSATSSNAFFYNTGYVPLDDWRDQQGILIEAHGGCILNDTANGHGFLWYGDFCNVAQQNGPNMNNSIGVWCYQSYDLMNWTNLGEVLPIPTSASFEYRPKVIFNQTTRQYVLWQYLSTGAANYGWGVATATNPTSFNYVNTNLQAFGSAHAGDFNLYQSPSGTAYIIANTNPVTGGVWIRPLDSTYTTNTAIAPVLVSANYLEAPILFSNINGGFNAIMSIGNFYSSQLEMGETNYYCPGTTPMGTWYHAGPVFASDPYNMWTTPTNQFNGQSAFIFQSPWNPNQIIYASDYWYVGSTPWWNILTQSYSTNVTINPADGTNGILYNSRQIWIPLTFNNTNAIVTTNANWNLAEWNKIFEIPASSINPGSFNASGALNVGGTNVNHTLINLTPVGAQLYTNTYGNTIQISATANITTTTVAGFGQLSLVYVGVQTNNFTSLSAVTSVLTGTTSNQPLSPMEIANGGIYYFTNTSSGTGDSSTPGPAQILVY